MKNKWKQNVHLFKENFQRETTMHVLKYRL